MMGAENRHYSYAKALRKQRITIQCYGNSIEHPYYNSLHRFSKNKIHCSCCICSNKTRNKGKRKHLARSYRPVLNYPVSDRKRLVSMDADLRELFTEEAAQ